MLDLKSTINRSLLEVVRDIGYKDEGSYLRSALWRIIQEEVLARDSYCCRNPLCPDRNKDGSYQRLAKGAAFIHYTAPALLGINAGLVFSLCSGCTSFCLQKPLDGKTDFEVIRKRVQKIVCRVGKAKWGAGNPALGKWYNEQRDNSRETSRRIFARLASESPEAHAFVLEGLESGKLPKRFKTYLGLEGESDEPDEIQP